MKFSDGQTVFSRFTGSELLVVRPAASIAYDLPNGQVVTDPQPAYWTRNPQTGHVAQLPESSLVTEQPASKPRFVNLCPICGGVMKRHDSFMDAAGHYRHEGC